ncbi:uncharacterized protein [Apostichopus japonicus]|uniref:uncharacterized protein isoform X1 n=1 Tax=Stichopus japonicus TaxID=307972 RepID=UPI003AB6C79A
MESSSVEEVYRLRQEYRSLHLHLTSGQQKLKSRVQLLKSASNRESKQRFSKRYQTKTSTPKDTDQRHIGRKLQKRFTSNHKTPHSCLRRVQSNSCQTTSGRASPKHFQRLPSCNQSAETEPEELFSSSDSNQLENDSVNAHLSSNELKHLRYGSQRKYLGRKAKERSVKIGQGIIAGSERKRRVSVNWKNGDCDKRKIKPELVFTPQPKSILLTPGIRQHGKTPSRVAFVERLNQSPTKKLDILPKERSLLGYDWIAGVLESGSQQALQSDEFFKEICHFRRTHRGQCVHESILDDSLPQRDPVVQESSELPGDVGANFMHKCVHNYTVNNRLFPVPLNEARDGASLCAVCQNKTDSHSTSTSPAYIRVSIPKSTLVSPYRVRSHRRRSFDPTDSIGLSKHCLSGWQCSKPSLMPTAGCLDIKSSLGSTAVRSNVNPEIENLPPETHTAGRVSRKTQELMNKSIALQLYCHKQAGMH